MVRIIEKQISMEMSKTKRCIIYDVWTKHGIHFLGLFASYSKKFPYTGFNSCTEARKFVYPLISVSPMAKKSLEKHNEIYSDCEGENSGDNSNDFETT